MEIILNRLRGTDKETFSLFGISGNILYMLYFILLIGFLTTWYYGLAAGILYYAGESMGWGEWVGALCNNEKVASQERLDEDAGHNNGIHWLANLIFKESENYKRYCQLALSIRGFYWWFPIMFFIGYLGLLPWYVAAISIFFLSIGFPIGIEIARNLNFTFVIKGFKVTGVWERQELIYGFIQFLCISLPILLIYFGILPF